ncbi:hypothetical protein [Asticcacaulis sp. EMRT-3]|uniref:hypothetical protein n=1 Tax=Asticcacaulis sp. EMRT-3 TaxID=3040349 RepID=UPI0024AFE9B6|nr:hypothetical protein [Asticcacaulis sp. EMRT-3]MDI7776508.1 hypothetical protein [Asticcacaulis sp. EMRT-3]
MKTQKRLDHGKHGKHGHFDVELTWRFRHEPQMRFAQTFVGRLQQKRRNDPSVRAFRAFRGSNLPAEGAHHG